MEERKLVIHHFTNNTSCRDVAKMLNRTVSTIQYIIKRYKQGNHLRNKIKINPKKRLTEADKRWLLRKVKKIKKLSAPAIAIDIEQYLGKSVSAENVRRILRRNKYNGRIARSKPLVSAKNRRQILELERYINKDYTFFGKTSSLQMKVRLTCLEMTIK